MPAPNHNRLSDLLEAVDAAIMALDGSPYATASIANPTWRASDQNLTASGAALEHHLLFSVSIESAPATGQDDGDSYQVEADLVVTFTFKAGAGEKVARERLAMAAAADLAEAVLTLPPTSYHSNARVIQGFQPGDPIGDFIPVGLRFAVLVDIPYRRRA